MKTGNVVKKIVLLIALSFSLQILAIEVGSSASSNNQNGEKNKSKYDPQHVFCVELLKKVEAEISQYFDIPENEKALIDSISAYINNENDCPVKSELYYCRAKLKQRPVIIQFNSRQKLNSQERDEFLKELKEADADFKSAGELPVPFRVRSRIEWAKNKFLQHSLYLKTFKVTEEDMNAAQKAIEAAQKDIEAAQKDIEAAIYILEQIKKYTPSKQEERKEIDDLLKSYERSRENFNNNFRQQNNQAQLNNNINNDYNNNYNNNFNQQNIQSQSNSNINNNYYFNQQKNQSQSNNNYDNINFNQQYNQSQFKKPKQKTAHKKKMPEKIDISSMTYNNFDVNFMPPNNQFQAGNSNMQQVGFQQYRK